MSREEARPWIAPLIALLIAKLGCGGTTTTGADKHIDVGGGKDASVETSDSGTGGTCRNCSDGGGSGRAFGTGGASGAGGKVAAGGSPGSEAGGASGAGGKIGAGGSPGSGGANPPGCCQKDSDCGDLRYVPCVNGVCKDPVPKHCWSNADCVGRGSCTAAFVCRCGLDCDQADTPGICTLDIDAGSDAGTARCQQLYAPRSACPSASIANCCDCLCGSCGNVAATCGADIRCNDLISCAILAHCTSLDECNQASTCKLVIDGLGGPQNVSAIRAAAVLACAVEARCDPCK